MKKFFLSIFVFAASAGYIAYEYMGGSSASAAPIVVTNQNSSASETTNGNVNPSTAPTTTKPSTKPVSKPTTVPTTKPVTTPTPTPTPVTKPSGQYVDGTYTGSAADAYYGMVQVKVTIQGGAITAVDFLQYPNDRRTSQYINSQAMPLLQSEAIQAQSANVSGVSGASDTSAAFRESLGNALAQAKNA